MSADNHAGKTQYGISQKDMAYLFGVYLGDGCCFNKSNFSIVSGDRDVIERTSLIANQLTGKNSVIREIKPNNTQLYFFRTYDRNLFQILTSQTKNKSELPQFVLDSDNNIKSELIAGLMDTDGYISTGITQLGWQRFSLGFVNSAQWIDQFILFLEKIGVKVGKKTLKKKMRSPNEKDCYQININLRSFVENKLYFYCKRKQTLLEKYKVNVKYQSY